MTVEKMVGKLMSFHNGIHGEFFREVADKLIELERQEKPSDRLIRKVEAAAHKVLHNPNSSKKAKTAAGSALTQPRRKVK